MKFTEELIENIWLGRTDEWVVIEGGEFVQDHKYQHAELIFCPKDKPDECYRTTISRSGSPYTDWDYLFDSNVEPVKKITKTITTTVWVKNEN